ncbi:MAG: response regulator, partial [Spirochaetaceae bacterium]|nr:response regulator [Spirochaetaceae bacterium]
MPKDAPGSAERRGLRHSIRTFLNHIAGYGDILMQEAEDSGEAELCGIYDRIRGGALELRESAIPCFLAPEEGGPAKEARESYEKRVYASLFDIIALVQTARRRILDGHIQRFLPDTDKILEAANCIVEIFEERIEGGLPFVEREEGEQASPSDEAQFSLPPAPRSGRILVVDDNLFNRELLSRHLERQGHVVCQASDGTEALALLREAPFDVLVLDVMMPGMNGYQLLERLKSDEKLKDLYVIVISALDDTKSIARCIQLGAEDYLPREFEPVILKARIESCLEKKSLKDKEQLYVAAVMETERRLRAELQEGAAYVRGLLPPRLDRPGLKTDWLFIPSLSLGGDVFGYHAIEGGRLALYLIDVSGHG